MSVAISWGNKMQLAKCDIMVGFPISSHILSHSLIVQSPTDQVSSKINTEDSNGMTSLTYQLAIATSEPVGSVDQLNFF